MFPFPGETVSSLQRVLSLDSPGGVGMCNAVVAATETGEFALFPTTWVLPTRLDEDVFGDGRRVLF